MVLYTIRTVAISQASELTTLTYTRDIDQPGMDSFLSSTSTRCTAAVTPGDRMHMMRCLLLETEWECSSKHLLSRASVIETAIARREKKVEGAHWGIAKGHWGQVQVATAHAARLGKPRAEGRNPRT